MPNLLKKKSVKLTLLISILILIGLQFFTVERSNPPIKVKTEWDSERTKELFYNACADCHSNETKWPFYSAIAPASWLISKDVIDGRKHYNISEDKELYADEMIEEIRKNEMPLKSYTLLHSSANLTEKEKEELIQGLIKTFRLEKKE